MSDTDITHRAFHYKSKGREKKYCMYFVYIPPRQVKTSGSISVRYPGILKFWTHTLLMADFTIHKKIQQSPFIFFRRKGRMFLFVH